mmetsp:Transcript_31954/g.93968  ORF Transcript_31954/g.93968 Transcript_31954/m.93968 type:complete len:525 (+) Transcript_31954:4605-6179(+)
MEKQKAAEAAAAAKAAADEAAAKKKAASSSEPASQGQKRKSADDDDDDDDADDGDSGGYNSDDEEGMTASRHKGASASSSAQTNAASGTAAAGGTATLATGAKSDKTPAKRPAPTDDITMPPPAAPTIIPPPTTTSSSMAASSTQISSSTGTSTAAATAAASAATGTFTGPPMKKAKLTSAERREERNQREKERSLRISAQINELRALLSTGGVIVPKGTKSAVLSEAANYIRMLQQHQYKSEIDRAQLIQQMQIIGGGALGPQAATAVRHVAAQNGVWSLGNFGGVPPRSAMQLVGQPSVSSAASATGASTSTSVAGSQPTQQQKSVASNEPQLVTTIDEHDYRFVFNSCAVGMAIASMGGAFIDCNQLFCQLSQYSKQEVCSMTIFNLTSRQDLQVAFDLISKMISPPPDGGAGSSPPCILRGAMKHRNDLGLSISLIKGSDGIAKCFSVTLIKNPASPYDPSRPIPATADFLRMGEAQSEDGDEKKLAATSGSKKDDKKNKDDKTPADPSKKMRGPAYTSG